MIRRFLKTFNWPFIVAWGGGIAFSVYCLIMAFHYLGPIIGRALQ